jgi:uncharacterized membrane protein YphA (DoxX/SURF4 family)
LGRLLIAASLAAHGVEKALDGASIRNALARVGFPPGGISLASSVLVATELGIAAWLVVGWSSRFAIVSALVLLSAYSAALIWLATRDGLAARCPCGGGLALSIGAAIARNIFLLASGGVSLALTPPRAIKGAV